MDIDRLKPRAGLPAARVVRRTTISCGPLYIVREEHRFARDIAGDTFVPAVRRRARFAGWRVVGAAVLGCVGIGGIALAATGVPTRGDYVVSIPIPDSVPAVFADAGKAVARHRPRRAPAAAQAVPAPVPADATEIISARSLGDATTAGFASRAAAIDAALRSGDMQEWRDARAGERGFVVAGPADRDGTQTCRNLSILTRGSGDSQERVDQQRQCRAGG
ncbi:hypothetical protein NED98_07410 [Sphingomonas sp. MMSM20]|uniref:hypothetical protein n=1 Tax=Sphingomonas lycopersici TaxID=2951807 RepID=UPI002237C4F8|nr:hypothetical protein [Sphingomonas lycopersici]MCW6530068.1 hypothetical protein [Sphingomonas lycopersici]